MLNMIRRFQHPTLLYQLLRIELSSTTTPNHVPATRSGSLSSIMDWRTSRRRIRAHTDSLSTYQNRKILSVIPGPSASSWWKGISFSLQGSECAKLTSNLSEGHFKEAFGTDGWAFQDSLKDKCKDNRTSVFKTYAHRHARLIDGSTATFLSLFGVRYHAHLWIDGFSYDLCRRRFSIHTTQRLFIICL
jgi:hypothetical protein